MCSSIFLISFLKITRWTNEQSKQSINGSLEPFLNSTLYLFTTPGDSPFSKLTPNWVVPPLTVTDIVLTPDARFFVLSNILFSQFSWFSPTSLRSSTSEFCRNLKLNQPLHPIFQGVPFVRTFREVVFLENVGYFGVVHVT